MRSRIALKGVIYPGGFSGERVVAIQLTNGESHRILAPRNLCWRSDGAPLERDEPAAGMCLEGIVAALLLRKNNKEIVVSTPDGEVLAVSPDISTQRPPTEADSHVPVGS